MIAPGGFLYSDSMDQPIPVYSDCMDLRSFIVNQYQVFRSTYALYSQPLFIFHILSFTIYIILNTKQYNQASVAYNEESHGVIFRWKFLQSTISERSRMSFHIL